MNTVSSLSMLILAFVCTISMVSAFVVLRSPSGIRVVSNIPVATGIFRMTLTAEESNIPDKLMEEVWRYAKKPLISVGGKGATNKHGNSLRQLLDDHTIVKVKVNTKAFGKSGDFLMCCPYIAHDRSDASMMYINSARMIL